MSTNTEKKSTVLNEKGDERQEKTNTEKNEHQIAKCQGIHKNVYHSGC